MGYRRHQWCRGRAGSAGGRGVRAVRVRGAPSRAAVRPWCTRLLYLGQGLVPHGMGLGAARLRTGRWLVGRRPLELVHGSPSRVRFHPGAVGADPARRPPADAGTQSKSGS